MRFTIFLCVFFYVCFFQCYGKNRLGKFPGSLNHFADSALKDSLRTDSATASMLLIAKKLALKDSIAPSSIVYFPGTSLQQYVKGQSAGVYIQEGSGEPGVEQNIFIRGLSTPLLTAKDIYNTQPLIVVDNIPIISKDHPFSYDIQQYDFNRIGPATNLLSAISSDNIASIEIIKNLSLAAKYGPRAVNGVIFIKTKSPEFKRVISVNSYVGLAAHNNVQTMNGASENSFRKPFYDRYATVGQIQNGPAYLRDSLYNIYFGPSNWTDLYYRNAPVYNVDASVTGGTNRSNFRVNVGTQKSGGIADETGHDRYSASFVMNMIPLKWLNVTTGVNASRLVRQRNRFMRDIFGETNYIPNLTNPISPNKDYYSKYLSELDKSFDKNKNNVLNGYLNLGFTFGKLTMNTRLAADYNEGFRDIFFPSTILESNSYVSNYFGYNQRLMAINTLDYQLKWNKSHTLTLETGQSLQLDTYSYNYGYANRGVNDYIKINLLDDPKEPLTGYFSYNPNNGFLNSLTARYLDNMRNNLISFYGKGNYSYKDKYAFSLLLRTDGSSTAQPTNRWFFSPAVNASWNLKNDLLASNKTINSLKLSAGYARLGRMESDDRFASGPQYKVEIGYTGQSRIGTFSGVSTLNRPYSSGWIGYDIPWAYSDQINTGLSIGILNNRVMADLEVYSRNDNNQLMNMPAFAEYGYNQAFLPGLNVNNSGIDASLTVNVFNSKKLTWTSSLNGNYNRNKLKALPQDLDRIVIGDRLLQVGESIDKYWVLENEGIYTSDSQIPVNPLNEKKLRMDALEGVELHAGDPRWKDQNGDYIIDNDDKVLKGHSLPVISGGFNNHFTYKKVNLDLNFYYNLGRDVINKEMANRFDFINRQNANNINSVNDITFWEKRGDYSLYPVYNPWSAAIPYRSDQDLFLENASFIKLRSVTLGYDLSNLMRRTSLKTTNLYVYGTANNLFTITPYTGRDPELADFRGYDTGYGQRIPRIYTVGFKMNIN
jgi:TonB-dependent starch-binding outer membrane protein SusC